MYDGRTGLHLNLLTLRTHRHHHLVFALADMHTHTQTRVHAVIVSTDERFCCSLAYFIYACLLLQNRYNSICSTQFPEVIQSVQTIDAAMHSHTRTVTHIYVYTYNHITIHSNIHKIDTAPTLLLAITLAQAHPRY